jgi:hypothetical protein
VSRAQLQAYLDEFVFRHNRRKTPAATEYEQIRGGKDLNPNGLGLAEATR